MQANYVSVIFLVSDVATAETVAYYRIQFILSGNIIRNAFKNRTYLDKCLNSSGFKVSYLKDIIISFLYIFPGVVLVLCVRFHDSIRENKHSELSQEFKILFSECVKLSLFIELFILKLYVVVCLLVKKRKLTVIGCAICSLSNTANGICGDVSYIRVYVTQRQGFLDKYRSMYKTIYKAFYNTKVFYHIFFCLMKLLSILMPALNLPCLLSYAGGIPYILIILNVTGDQWVLFYLTISIISAFRNVTSLISNFCYGNYCNQKNCRTKCWFLQCGIRELIFDWIFYSISFTIFGSL